MIFTPDEEIAICERYRMGESSVRLAKDLFCSQPTVLKILRKHSVATRRTGSYMHESTLKIIDMYNKGYRTSHICKTLGCTQRSVANALLRAKRHGRAE